MSSRKGKPGVPTLVQKELDEIEAEGHTYEIVRGTRHWHIYINGVCASVIPQGTRTKQEADRRAVLNVRSSIRRVLRETTD